MRNKKKEYSILRHNFEIKQQRHEHSSYRPWARLGLPPSQHTDFSFRFNTAYEEWKAEYFLSFFNIVDFCSTRWQHRFRAHGVPQGTKMVQNFLSSFKQFQARCFGWVKTKRVGKDHCSHFQRCRVFTICHLAQHLPASEHFAVHTTHAVPFAAALPEQLSTGWMA